MAELLLLSFVLVIGLLLFLVQNLLLFFEIGQKSSLFLLQFLQLQLQVRILGAGTALCGGLLANTFQRGNLLLEGRTDRVLLAKLELGLFELSLLGVEISTIGKEVLLGEG